MIKHLTVSKVLRCLAMCLLVITCLQLAGCNANVGVGLSVGVPVGNHGYMRVGTGRWY